MAEVTERTIVPISTDNVELNSANNKVSNNENNFGGAGRPRKDGAPVIRRKTITECSDCGAKVRNGVMLERHISKKHPDKLKTYSCQICSSLFTSMMNLTNHVISHWNVDDKCPLSSECSCTKRFSRKAKILHHLIEHHQKDDKQSIIGKENYNYKNKRKHHKCSHCNKVFEKQSQLIRHIRIHTGEKPFTCAFCGLKFNQKSSLVTHARIHTNSRLFQCPKCPVSFVQKVNLKSHMKNLHPLKANPDRIGCQHCSCLFRSVHSLNMHIAKIHKTLTEDQMINDTINDVMEGLASLNNITQSDIEILQKQLSNEQNQDIQSKCNKNNIKRDSNVNKVKKVVKPKFRINFHQCTLCEKSFKTSSELNKHLTNNHTKDTNKNNNELNLNNQTEQLTNINNDQKLFDLSSSTFTDINFVDNQKIESNSNIFLNESQFNILVNDTYDNISNEIVYINNSNLDQSNYLLTDNSQIDNVEVVQKQQQQMLEEQFYYEHLPIEGVFANNNADCEYQISINPADVILDKSVQNVPTISIPNTNVKDDLILPEINNVQLDNQEQQYFINLNQPQELVNVNSEVNIIESKANEKVQHIDLDQFLIPESKKKGYKYPPLENRCDKCPASFKKKYDLVRHTRIHTMEKPFFCDICGERFSLKCTLKSHQSVHLDTPLKKALCKVCGKKFANKSTLKVHNRVHEGVKPYQCPLCSDSFRTLGQRTNHVNAHLKPNGIKKSKNNIKQIYASCDINLKE